MKKKKGFTLIELLAVIVILAVLAIIVTPLISDVITNAKKSAAQQSASNYVEAVNNAISTCMIKGEYTTDGEYNISDLNNMCVGKSTDIKGKKPSGTITIRNNVVLAYDFDVDEYNFVKGEEHDMVSWQEVFFHQVLSDWDLFQTYDYHTKNVYFKKLII